MNRREALTKLGAAGAIAAGGSMVLSSRDVAFAASGECLLDGAPSPITMQMAFTSSDQKLNITPSLGAAPSGVTITYQWSNADTALGTTGTVAIEPGTSTSATVVLERPSAKSKKWLAGDSFTVRLVVTWSCTEATDNVGEYVLTHTLGSLSPQISSPVANSAP